MSYEKAIVAGIEGDQLSRRITGTDEVSASRSAIATGAGALIGGGAIGAVGLGASAVGATALAAAAAPVVVPVAIVSAGVSFIASLFD